MCMISQFMTWELMKHCSLLVYDYDEVKINVKTRKCSLTRLSILSLCPFTNQRPYFFNTENKYLDSNVIIVYDINTMKSNAKNSKVCSPVYLFTYGIYFRNEEFALHKITFT